MKLKKKYLSAVALTLVLSGISGCATDSQVIDPVKDFKQKKMKFNQLLNTLSTAERIKVSIISPTVTVGPPSSEEVIASSGCTYLAHQGSDRFESLVELLHQSNSRLWNAHLPPYFVRRIAVVITYPDDQELKLLIDDRTKGAGYVLGVTQRSFNPTYEGAIALDSVFVKALFTWAKEGNAMFRYKGDSGCEMFLGLPLPK